MTKRYAIIGAGAAGTYAAWRLAQLPGIDPEKITVYDSFRIGGKPHIGGRLWSARLPGLDHVRRAELGGMRFLDNQKLVNHLVRYLGLSVINFPVDSASTGYMLRGSLLRPSDFGDPAKVPYKLAAREQKMSPGRLLSYGVESIVPNAPYLTAAEWDQIYESFKVQGELLRNQGAWTLLQSVLSQEGFSLAQDGSGYDTFTTNWNAADAMQWIAADFSPSTQYLYLQDGFQALPKTLFAQATVRGVEYRNWGLKKFEFLPSGGVALKFEDAMDDTPHDVECDVLILAMPRRSLEILERPYNRWLDDHIPSVSPEPMFKFFVGYRYPWWRTLGMTLGRTVTDGPLRQIYYWGSNYQQFFDDSRNKNPPIPDDGTSQNSLIMVYCDGRNAGYWRPLFASVKYSLGMRGTTSRYTSLRASDVPHWMNNSHFRVLDLDTYQHERSIQILLSAIADQMRAAHGVSYIPAPYVLAYADWTADPLGGAYNLWEPGFNSREVMREMLTPYGDRPVYVIGEAYSLHQGWVEGALETAELLCQSQFDMPPPNWLPADVK